MKVHNWLHLCLMRLAAVLKKARLLNCHPLVLFRFIPSGSGLAATLKQGLRQQSRRDGCCLSGRLIWWKSVLIPASTGVAVTGAVMWFQAQSPWPYLQWLIITVAIITAAIILDRDIVEWQNHLKPIGQFQKSLARWVYLRMCSDLWENKFQR